MTKITLATLAAATPQQVFDQAARHLLTQNKKSINTMYGGACLYRSTNGACAAGCFISDDEYKAEMDERVDGIGTNWNHLRTRGLVPSTQHNNLIRRLQIIHDAHSPDDWKHQLESMAACNELSTDVLKEFP